MVLQGSYSYFFHFYLGFLAKPSTYDGKVNKERRKKERTFRYFLHDGMHAGMIDGMNDVMNDKILAGMND